MISNGEITVMVNSTSSDRFLQSYVKVPLLVGDKEELWCNLKIGIEIIKVQSIGWSFDEYDV